MRNRLVVREDLWRKLRDHLLRDMNEHLAFILAGCARVNGGNTLLGQEIILIDDSDLEYVFEVECGLSLRLETLVQIMNETKAKGLVLVEAHSHPLSGTRVRFSRTDLEGQQEFYTYLRDVFGDLPYGALVLGTDSADGLIWIGNQRPAPITEIRIIGGSCLTLVTTPGAKPKRRSASSARGLAPIHDRQILALGEAGQRSLQQIHVAIVGLGGLGSIVAQQLAHLGVQEFTLIDPDTVEDTNLNRLVGARRSDVGRSKVKVAVRTIRTANSVSKVKPIATNVCALEALNALKAVDLMFGCVDSDSGRLILNELALAYYVPYIDTGVGIETDDGRIADAGGRVVVWTPGRPCLLCSGEINLRIAAEELETEEQRRFRRQHGYVVGSDVPAPSVISLNGTIASLAVGELIALVTGLRKTNHYTYYDLLEQRVGPRIVKANERCVACATAGVGDRSNIERYSEAGLPTQSGLDVG